VHRPLGEQGQDGGPDIAAPGASGSASFAVVRTGASGAATRATMVVPTALAVGRESAARAASGVEHESCLS